MINPRIGFSDAVFYNPDAFQDADVLLFHAKGNVLSWMIRAFSHSFWNHSGLLYWKPAEGERRGEWMVVEALWHVSETPMWRYFTKDFALGVYAWPESLTPEQCQTIITMSRFKSETLPKFAREQVGKGYDVPLVIKIRWEQMAHGYESVGGLDPITKPKPRKWYDCSLLVYSAGLQVVRSLGFGELVSPGDLAKKLRRKWLYNCEEKDVAK